MLRVNTYSSFSAVTDIRKGRKGMVLVREKLYFPGGPLFPGGLSRPLSPLGPGIPCDPLSPIWPSVPSLPCGPLDPGTPGIPGMPLDSKMPGKPTINPLFKKKKFGMEEA